jgi:hypothetical protein
MTLILWYIVIHSSSVKKIWSLWSPQRWKSFHGRFFAKYNIWYDRIIPGGNDYSTENGPGIQTILLRSKPFFIGNTFGRHHSLEFVCSERSWLPVIPLCVCVCVRMRVYGLRITVELWITRMTFRKISVRLIFWCGGRNLSPHFCVPLL